jgi:cyclohexadienyl dehydratase
MTPQDRVSRRAWLAALGFAPVVLRAALARAEGTGALPGSGVLRVGSSGDYAPFTSVPDDMWTGLDIDLAMRLAKDLGARIELVPFTWSSLATDVGRGSFDVAASGVTVRADRALVGRFSRPYATTGAVALVRPRERPRFPGVAALNRPGVRLAVNRGGHLERVARRLFPEATLLLQGRNVELAAQVTSGSADAALSDSAEAYAVRGAGLATVGPFTRDRKALLVSAGAPALAAWCDEWLRARELDGFLPSLRRRWLGPAGGRAWAADRESVLADVQLRSELMPFVAAAKRASNLPIEDTAQEARVIARVRGVASAAGLDPDSVAALYAVLIGAAKSIQTAAAPAPQAATLDQLRSALGALDEHLIRGLRFTRATSPNAWRAAVAAGVEAEGLTPDLLAAIGASLGNVR